MTNTSKSNRALIRWILIILTALSLMLCTLSVGVSAAEDNSEELGVVDVDGGDGSGDNEAEAPETEDPEEDPTEEDPAEEDPTEEDPTEEDPVEEDPVEEDPVEEDPTEEDPVEEDPVEEDPVEEDPTEEDPVEEDPVEEDSDPADSEPEAEAETLDTSTTVLIAACAILALVSIVLIIMLALGKGGKAGSKVDSKTGYLAVPEIGKLHNQGARPAQQDSFTVSPADAANTMGVLAVVADGMGGLEDGDKVSQKAVETALETFLSNSGEQFESLMWRIVAETNKAVNTMLGPSKLYKSGSTMVSGLIRQGKFMWFSVGDSRIYLWRDGSLIQLNREHIYRHDLELKAANGSGTVDGAFTASDASGLTSFFGMGTLRHVDMPAAPLDICAGDRYILMSDGVYNALTHDEIVSCLESSQTAEEAADALGKAVAAKEYSNQDNYTAVVLGV